MTQLHLGPVLSFRGVGSEDEWKVTALVAIDSAAKPPALTIEGRRAKPPMVLLEHAGKSYLRYDLTCKQKKEERRVTYQIKGIDHEWSFTVPGKGYAPRMAYVSCNGYAEPSALRKLIKAENAVWEDLLCNHDKEARPLGYMLDKEQLWHETRTHDKGNQRFHLLLMGGDQIYFDSIWEDLKQLKGWIGLHRDEQVGYPVSAELDKAIEDYYFNLYSTRWLPAERHVWGGEDKSRDASLAMASLPTVMMWDDHDIFDGWGSYSPEMQNSPLFQRLFFHARRAFWVFQMQHAIEMLPDLKLRTDVKVRTNDPLFERVDWAKALKADKLKLPLLPDQPGFSFAHALGPLYLVVADLRTERSHEQVMGSHTWDALHACLREVPANERTHPGNGCQHLLFMSSVPIVHPKLSLAEAYMDSFGSEHVLDSSADDLKDHWTNDAHEGERRRLIETLLDTARKKKLRVSIVSGDVHVAAWGTAYKADVGPRDNWAHIQQFTSTAVVHPSLVSVSERLFFFVLNTVARLKQSLDINLHAEMMLFPGSNKYVQASRNWLALELDLGTGNANGAKLWATWRCESKQDFTNHLLATDPVHKLE